MEKSSQKAIQIKCPECLNKMNVYLYTDGTLRGNCKRCKSAIIQQNHSEKEKRIRIIKN